MLNSIVILWKVFKFEGNPISRSYYKFLAFFSLLKKITLCRHSRYLSVRLFFEEKIVDNSSEHEFTQSIALKFSQNIG